MSVWRIDPGDCIICGAPHCACGGGPITVVQLAQRDARGQEVVTTSSAPPLRADIIQATLPPGQFTTGTYRRRATPARKGADTT